MKIIIGAGETSQDGWTSTNKEQLNILNNDDWSKYYLLESMDAMLAEHVWEHMTIEEGIIAAKNCYQYLKPDGYMRIAVPDINFDNEAYQNTVQVGGPGPIDHPAYTHKIVYDYKTLKHVFESAGFEVDLLEYCDENHKFHYKYWNATDGKIGRSFRYDTRNSLESLGMVSLIIDAKKVITI